MCDKKTYITLHQPKIEGNRLFLSWEPHYLLTDSNYWLEYAGSKELHCQPDALLEAYLPICLAFSLLGDVAISLPGPLAPHVLETWKRVCCDTSLALSKRTSRIEFIIPDSQETLSPEKANLKETALLFGGGSESLLTLAHLLEKKISPYLVSLWGAGWQGSDPVTNHARFVLEEQLCQEFGLRIFRVRTNIRRLFDNNKNFKPYLPRGAFIINAALFLPINISVLLPVAEQLNLREIVSGNEKESSLELGCYSLSYRMTKNLNTPGKYVKYYSYLEDLSKVEILRELHHKYPRIGKYQYSCWRSINERWCLNCEKCLRNYLIYKIFDIELSTVGMEEVRILLNLANIIRETKKKCRKHRAFFAEWSGIKKAAIAQNKKEIVKIIDSFCRQSFIKRIFLSKSKSA